MKKKTLVMNVDYFDEVSIRPNQVYGPEDVEKLVRQCAEAGVDAMYWRAIGLGVAGYPSRYLLKPEVLGDSDMSLLLARMEPGQRDTAQAPAGHDKNFVLETQYRGQYRQSMTGWSQRIAQSLKTMDPLAVSRDACRRHGIAWHIWHDFLDERHNLSLTRHPEWLVTGRDGQTRFPGLRSYAVTDAVNDQLQVIDELLAYKPDGLYLCTSCHNRHLSFPEPADYFGFEDPIVQAYQQTHGVNIREQDFDVEAWHDLKGAQYTRFFRQVKERARKINAKLAIGTQLGQHTILTSPVFSTHIPYRFTTQWQTWVDEGIADVLILGDYEWPWDHVPIWEAKGMAWPKGVYPADQTWEAYAQYAQGKAELYWFSSWLSAYPAKHQGASSDSLAGAMKMRADTLQTTDADGICLHEAMTFELESDGFDTLKAMRQQLPAAALKA